MPDVNVSRSEPPVPLRDYVEALLRGLRDYVDTRLHAIEEAVKIASAASDKRLEGMNEFRASLRDQSDQFMGRATAEAKFTAVEKELKDFGTWRAALDGKASQKSVNGATLISVAALLMGIINIILKLVG